MSETLPLRIGSLASAAGVGIETIRYYERRALLGRPDRPYGGQRAYPREYVERVRFIKRAQALGFSLDEVKLLVELSVGEHCAETRTVAEQKKRLVEKKIADLRAIHAALDKLTRACGSGRKGRGCPIIDSLARAEPR